MTGTHMPALRRPGTRAGGRHRLHPERLAATRTTTASSLLPRGLPADPVRPDLPRTSSVPARRVRHQVRDGAVVVAFSAAASTGLALALLLVVQLAS